MVARQSLVSELLSAISMPKLRAMPAYLSETDALTVDDFMQCSFAADYVLNTSHVHWGGEVNSSHIFDIYCDYQAHRDSVKTRLDMIKYVTENSHRYAWDGHLFLRLNNLSLETWINKMSYWGNCADALSLYALSDMYGVHTCVITKTKPWTTIDNNFKGTAEDEFDICQIKLAYLGENKFGRLWKKVVKDAPSHLGANFNYRPMITLPPVPIMEKLEAAQTLLDMQTTELQEPVQLVAPPEFQGPEVDANSDAMDKITGHFDDACSASKLKLADAMDQVIKADNETLHVETPTGNGDIQGIKLQANTSDDTNAFYVETPSLKKCHVSITPLETIIFGDSKAESSKGLVNDLPAGEHFTRSRTCSKPERVSRRPRKVSTDVHYTETETSENDKKQCHKARKPKTKPSAEGLSAT